MKQNKFSKTQERAIGEVMMEIKRAKDLHPGEFVNPHHGYAVLLEEVRELENEVFFGKKKANAQIMSDLDVRVPDIETRTHNLHKAKMREEAIQIAAMAIRFASELT